MFHQTSHGADPRGKRHGIRYLNDIDNDNDSRVAHRGRQTVRRRLGVSLRSRMKSSGAGRGFAPGRRSRPITASR
ncbi:hypothetical protein EYF80_050913 [Liparis tanakae]|uniref:Uncharacterized protein n=1 Tax=Liparis tanakae TaxID=230148 RepID=A0A4Z2FDS1_9TELE|nr:hypothetical protein EYF80_050913 [Liparis tanakae]